MIDIDIKNSYRIDIGSSIVMFQKDENKYNHSECYNNAFKFTMNNFKHDNKIVIGYVLSTNGIRKVAVRHAWNIINDIAVDVTMFADNEHPISVINYRYLPAAEYNIKEFIKALEKNNNYPALPKTKKEYKIRRKLKSLNFEILE